MKVFSCAAAAVMVLAGCQSQTGNVNAAAPPKTGAGSVAQAEKNAPRQRENTDVRPGSYVPPGNNVEEPWSFNYVVPRNADSSSKLSEQGARVAGVRFGTGGEFYIAANLRNKNGLTEVCGVWAQTDNQSAYTRSKLRLASKMVSQASVQYRAKAIVRNLSFMGEVAWDDFEWGAPTTCKVTTKPWRPEYASDKVQVRIPTAGAYQL